MSVEALRAVKDKFSEVVDTRSHLGSGGGRAPRGLAAVAGDHHPLVLALDTEVTQPFELVVSASAARAIAEVLPEPVAAAVTDFVTGPLLEHPQRVGHELRGELAGIHSARRGHLPGALPHRRRRTYRDRAAGRSPPKRLPTVEPRPGNLGGGGRRTAVPTCPYSWTDGTSHNVLDGMSAGHAQGRACDDKRTVDSSCDNFEGTEQIQQLVVARAISGLRIS